VRPPARQEERRRQELHAQELQALLARSKAELLDQRLRLEQELQQGRGERRRERRELACGHRAQLEAARRQRAGEVAVVEARVREVLGKKDAAAAALRQELEAVAGRLVALEALCSGAGWPLTIDC
jgi:hypothetical protein